MRAIKDLETEWRNAVEGMTFFGEPVQDMTAEQLLLLVGHLVTEKRQIESELRSRRASALRIPAGGGFPVIDHE